MPVPDIGSFVVPDGRRRYRRHHRRRLLLCHLRECGLCLSVERASLLAQLLLRDVRVPRVCCRRRPCPWVVEPSR